MNATISQQKKSGTSWPIPGVSTVRTAGPLSWAVLIAVVGLVIGLVSSGNQSFNWSYALCDGVFALGCGIVISWGRIAAFGQGLFFATGGYTAALISGWHLPTLVLVLVSALAAALVAFVFSIITVRLDFAAFAMVTLVIGQAGNQLIYTVRQLGGENGLIGIPRPSFIGGATPQDDKSFYFYCLFVLVILVFACRWFYQSTTGRAVRAVRDDGIRAESLGINIARTRVLVYTAGAFVCGIAGVMYGQLQGVVDPSMGDFNQSTVGVMMVVIGGLGTFLGAVLGGIAYRWLDLVTTQQTTSPDLYLGLIFIAVVMLTPVLTGLLRRMRTRYITRRKAAAKASAASAAAAAAAKDEVSA